VDLLSIFQCPITVLVGHFGSGKTEVAVNLAFAMREFGQEVALADLDVVKPYFRCRLVRHDLEAAGVTLIAPEGERFFADLPIVVPQVRQAAERALSGGARLLLDVGGDDTGARVLGSLGACLPPAQTDVLFVVNANRPFAEDEPAILSMLRDIETASHLAVTGLVANEHLMDETAPEDVLHGIRIAESLARAIGVPVRGVAALAPLCSRLEQGGTRVPLIPITRHIVPPHVRRRPGSRRSLAV
jgi:energy-coupling factor transporter ATP-binding protein EcfA2